MVGLARSNPAKYAHSRRLTKPWPRSTTRYELSVFYVHNPSLGALFSSPLFVSTFNCRLSTFLPPLGTSHSPVPPPLSLLRCFITSILPLCSVGLASSKRKRNCTMSRYAP